MKEKVDLFHCTQPCGNCPYRTDAPLRLWHVSEYIQLMEKENDHMGAVYKCHKANGSICVGWLMKQEEKGLPSIMLRLSLLKNNVTREYLESLHTPAPLYATVEEMIQANYPELKMLKNAKRKNQK